MHRNVPFDCYSLSSHLLSYESRFFFLSRFSVVIVAVFFFTFLLAHIICTERFYYDIYTWAYNVPRSNSLHHSPSSPTKTTSTGFIILFSYAYTKYIDHIHPLSPFPLILLLLTRTHSWYNLFYLSGLPY
jgi:hypothetical protein